MSSSWIFSIPLTSRSSREWSSWQKWAATGFSTFFVRMSERCPFIRTCWAFSVSPTYCSPHLHEIRYTRFLDLHVKCVLMLCCLPVLLLLKLLHVSISAEHLQRLLLHGALPVLVGGAGVVTLARTSRSLRLRGRLNATRGGLGIASRSLWEVLRIDRYFLVILARLASEGWNVATRSVLFRGCFCGWGFYTGYASCSLDLLHHQ